MTEKPTITRRIYLSMTADWPLSKEKNDLKWEIVRKVEALEYQCEIFGPPLARPGMASRMGWTPKNADEVARACIGGLLIGMPRWTGTGGGRSTQLASEYVHYEGAVLHTLGLPILLLAQSDIEWRGIFHPAGYHITTIPHDAGAEWVKGETFLLAFEQWVQELRERRDIFMGYCSTSSGIANNLKRFIQRELNASVLDWQVDFGPGDSILSQISIAAKRCSAGLFLFTKDDLINGDSTAAPRDNVVFEAGYFAHAKGHHRVMIVRESGTKMPADLGGQIYATLEDRANIAPIEQQIRRFVGSL